MRTTLNIKTDTETKIAVEELAKSLGLTVSAFVESHLKELIRSAGSTLFPELKLRPEVAKRIEKAIAEAKRGKNVSPTFTSVDEMRAWLNK